MLLANDPTSREGPGTEPPSVQSLKHEELESVIGQLQSQLRVLKHERAAILKRIGVIKKTVVGLADLFGPNVINGELQDFLSLQSAHRSRIHPALTDLCRQLLREASEPLTVRQILGQLQEKSPAALAGHKHRHNSLRMILKRLVAYGDAEPVLNEEGTRAWRSTSSSSSAGEREF
jgi:hypothetical protein